MGGRGSCQAANHPPRLEWNLALAENVISRLGWNLVPAADAATDHR
jgi:hypothetical protein